MDLLAVAIAVAAVLVALPLLASFSSVSKLPGPWTLPLIGDTLKFLKSPARYMIGRYLQFGSVYKVNLIGMPNLVVLNDLDAARSLLKAAPEDALFYAPGAAFTKLFPKEVMANMLVNDQHRFWRRAMNQSLSPQGVACMIPEVNKLISRVVGEWMQQGEIDIWAASKDLALDLGVSILAGISVTDSNRREMIKLAGQFNEGVFDGLALDIPGTPLHTALKARGKLKDLLWSEMGHKLGDISDKYGKVDQDLGAPLDGPYQYINMLEAQIRGSAPYREVNADLLVEKCVSNLLAATETTRHVFLASMALISMCPRVRDKLVEEQRQFMASHGDDLSFRTLNAITYLDATIKEVVRLIPASNFMIRQLAQPLTVGNHVLDTGTVCLMSVHLLHAVDPVFVKDGPLVAGDNGLPIHMDYLDNVEAAFQPERWLQEDTRPRNHFNFGGGTHLCLGIHVAYAEGKLLLAHLLRDGTFDLVDKDMFKKMKELFPGPKPAPGTGTVRLTRRPLTPAGSPNGAAE